MMRERLSKIRQEIVGIVSILGGLYLALSLFTYSEWDPSPFVVTNLPARNYGGIIGSYIADTLFSVIGISSLLLPFLLCLYGIRKMLGKKVHWITIAGILLLMLSLSLLSYLSGKTLNMEHLSKAGGLVGLIASKALISFFFHSRGIYNLHGLPCLVHHNPEPCLIDQPYLWQGHPES